MTTWQAMHALERIGYGFELHGDGVRATLQGKAPPEASALLDIACQDRAAARAYVIERQSGAVVVDDGCTYGAFDALAIAQAVRKGEARLLGNVIFHREDMTCTVRWEPLKGEASAVLLRHRERLKNSLESRLKAIEATPWESVTPEQAEALCARYERYFWMKEVMRNERERLPV